MSANLVARGARVGGSAASAVVVALGLVVVTPWPGAVPIESHRLQLSSVVLSAAAYSSALDVAPTVPAAAVQSQTQPVAQAAATGVAGILDTPLGSVLTLVNLVTLPIWYLFTPITLPLSMVAAAAIVPDGLSDSLSGLLFLMGTGVIFLTGPLGVLNAFTGGFSTTGSASASASRRSGTAATAAATAAPADYSSSDPVAIKPSTAPTIGQDSSSDRRSRVRAAARQSGDAPRAAAVAVPESAARIGSGAELRESLPADDSNGNSKARAKTRR